MNIRHASAEDIRDLEEFYKTQFPEKTALHDMQVWTWTFIDNPILDEPSSFYIMEDAGCIQGGIGYIPVTILMDGNEYPASHPVNFFVTDKYKGLHALRLFRRVFDKFSIHFASYVSNDATRLFKSAGFKNVGYGLKNYYLSLKKDDDIKTGFALSRASIIFLARNLWNRTVCTLIRSSSPAMHVHNRDIISLDICPDTNSPEAEFLGIKKDYDYLKWRYYDSPKLNCKFFYVARNGKPRVLYVVHFETNKKQAVILDIVYDKRSAINLISVLAAIVNYCRKQDIHIISSSFTNISIGKLFRLLGFGSADSSYGFLVYAKDPDLQKRITSVTDWSFFIGNTDAY